MRREAGPVPDEEDDLTRCGCTSRPCRSCRGPERCRTRRPPRRTTRPARHCTRVRRGWRRRWGRPPPRRRCRSSWCRLGGDLVAEDGGAAGQRALGDFVDEGSIELANAGSCTPADAQDVGLLVAGAVDEDVAVAGDEVVPGASSQGHVVGARCEVAERAGADGGVVGAGGVVAERINPVGRVEGAGGFDWSVLVPVAVLPEPVVLAVRRPWVELARKVRRVRRDPGVQRVRPALPVRKGRRATGADGSAWAAWAGGCAGRSRTGRRRGPA